MPLTKLFHWDYQCGKCGEVGSAKVAENVSVTNAAVAVAEAHAAFNPDCHKKYQGRWLRVFAVGPMLAGPRVKVKRAG